MNPLNANWTKTLNEVKGATLNLFADRWLKNFEKNSNEIKRNPGVNVLTEKFRGVPSVVIGAGPSLDKNIKYLRYARNKTLIIACDAALKVVVNEGIQPDFVTALDPQADIIRFFDGVNTSALTLVAPSIVHPSVLAQWKGRVIFYNKYAPDIPVLVKIQKSAPHIGELIPGGSVLSISYCLAYKAGSNPITFIGQDLSYPQGRIYSKGSLYEEKSLEATMFQQGENIIFETDVLGRPVSTLKSMFVTREWFEWAFTSWKRTDPATIMNCTEGGILKNKCSLLPFSEFVTRYCAGKEMNLGWKIQKLIKNKM
jgi:hypothetical protein